MALAFLASAACAGDAGARHSADAEPDRVGSARPAAAEQTPAPAMVRPGIDVLIDDSLHLVQGRRVGLITNHTGLDRTGRSSVDRLAEHPDVELVALFSPEHGIEGRAEAGESVASRTDARTGLPIHSLGSSICWIVPVKPAWKFCLKVHKVPCWISTTVLIHM